MCQMCHRITEQQILKCKGQTGITKSNSGLYTGPPKNHMPENTVQALHELWQLGAMTVP